MKNLDAIIPLKQTKSLTTNHKYILRGIGKVYNCDCTAGKEGNQYHHLDCASRANLTLTYELTWWQRLKSYFLIPLQDNE